MKVPRRSSSPTSTTTTTNGHNSNHHGGVGHACTLQAQQQQQQRIDRDDSVLLFKLPLDLTTTTSTTTTAHLHLHLNKATTAAATLSSTSAGGGGGSTDPNAPPDLQQQAVGGVVGDSSIIMEAQEYDSDRSDFAAKHLPSVDHLPADPGVEGLIHIWECLETHNKNHNHNSNYNNNSSLSNSQHRRRNNFFRQQVPPPPQQQQQQQAEASSQAQQRQQQQQPCARSSLPCPPFAQTAPWKQQQQQQQSTLPQPHQQQQTSKIALSSLQKYYQTKGHPLVNNNNYREDDTGGAAAPVAPTTTDYCCDNNSTTSSKSLGGNSHYTATTAATTMTAATSVGYNWGHHHHQQQPSTLSTCTAQTFPRKETTSKFYTHHSHNHSHSKTPPQQQQQQQFAAAAVFEAKGQQQQQLHESNSSEHIGDCGVALPSATTVLTNQKEGIGEDTMDISQHRDHDDIHKKDEDEVMQIEPPCAAARNQQDPMSPLRCSTTGPAAAAAKECNFSCSSSVASLATLFCSETVISDRQLQQQQQHPHSPVMASVQSLKKRQRTTSPRNSPGNNNCTFRTDSSSASSASKVHLAADEKEEMETDKQQQQQHIVTPAYTPRGGFENGMQNRIVDATDAASIATASVTDAGRELSKDRLESAEELFGATTHTTNVVSSANNNSNTVRINLGSCCSSNNSTMSSNNSSAMMEGEGSVSTPFMQEEEMEQRSVAGGEDTETLIADYDVVLGDTHTPTSGTMVYRQVRQRFAKKNITRSELAALKKELFDRMCQQPSLRPLLNKGRVQVRFWFNRKNTSKIQANSITGYLAGSDGTMKRERGSYGLATDKAIQEDVKSAPKASRSRARFVFNIKKGSLQEVVQKAIEQSQQWVGQDAEKELYAKGFQDDLDRIIPWRSAVQEKQLKAEETAARQPSMRQTHLREAHIHSIHGEQLEDALIELVNRLGNMMLDRHRRGQVQQKKKSSSSSSFGSGFRKDPDEDDEDEDDDDDMGSGGRGSRNGGGGKSGESSGNSGRKPPLGGGRWPPRSSSNNSNNHRNSNGSASSDCQAAAAATAVNGAAASRSTGFVSEGAGGEVSNTAMVTENPNASARNGFAAAAGQVVDAASLPMNNSFQGRAADFRTLRSATSFGSSSSTQVLGTTSIAGSTAGSCSVAEETTISEFGESPKDQQHSQQKQMGGRSVLCESLSTMTLTTSKSEVLPRIRPNPPEEESISIRKPRSTPKGLSIMFTQLMQISSEVRPKQKKFMNAVDVTPCSVPREVRSRMAMEDDQSISSIEDSSFHRGWGSAVLGNIASGGNNKPLELLLQARRANGDLLDPETAVPLSDIPSPAGIQIETTGAFDLTDKHVSPSFIRDAVNNGSCFLRQDSANEKKKRSKGERNGKDNWDNVLQYHRMMLEMRLLTLGKEHPDTAKSYSNIGLVLSKKGDWDQALRYHKMAQEIREVVFGNCHPETAKSYSSIGFVLSKKYEWEQALKFHRQALTIREKTLGNQHTDTAKSYSSMGFVLSRRGDWVEALRYHRMALEVREAVMRTQSHMESTALSSFGSVRASWQQRLGRV